jgi:hypothetical protein
VLALTPSSASAASSAFAFPASFSTSAGGGKRFSAFHLSTPHHRGSMMRLSFSTSASASLSTSPAPHAILLNKKSAAIRLLGQSMSRGSFRDDDEDFYEFATDDRDDDEDDDDDDDDAADADLVE